MNIVVTMAGLGKRFTMAGYEIPKYMIEAQHRTLFEWSIESLLGFDIPNCKFIFVARETKGVEGFIADKCSKMGIKQYQVKLLQHCTDGQATSALLASEYWNAKDGLLIYNIDTYIEKGQLETPMFVGDGFIPCFLAKGSHWSFVQINENNGSVIAVKEKNRISDYCSVGAYYFKNCDLYRTLYEEYYGQDSNLVAGERYVAPLYNLLLQRGGRVNMCLIPANKVHVLGTPEEIQEFEQLSIAKKLKE